MVQQGDFTVQLVDAETKVPFKEHYKDDKVYVEVEPDIDYFISMKKTGKSDPGCSKCYFGIDNRNLGYYRRYNNECVYDSPSFCGLLQYENGVSTHNALKFVKPPINDDGSSTSRLLMGKIELKVYEGIFDGYKQPRNSSRSSCDSWKDAPTLESKKTKATEKKILRSVEGSIKLSKSVDSMGIRYRTGRLLDTIVLNYCAAVGLIEVGVLQKPSDVWGYQRMLCPLKSKDSLPVAASKKIRTQTTVSGSAELFDLTAAVTPDESLTTDRRSERDHHQGSQSQLRKRKLNFD